MLYASFHGTRVRHSIGLSIPPKVWDQAKCRLRPLTGEYILINSRLNELADKGNAIILHHKINAAELTADELISQLLHKTKKAEKKKAVNVIEQFKTFIEYKRDRLRPDSMRVMTTVLNNIIESRLMTALTGDAAAEYEHWMVKNKYNPNVILKHIQVINQFAAHIGHPLNYKSALRRKEHDSISLTEDEIKAIWLTKCSSMYQNAKKIFVLMCYTGMRISDALAFKPSKIQDIKGERCIVYHAIKTGKKCVIPVNISPYLDNIILDMFHVISEQRFRVLMKELCKRAGITSLVEVTRHEGQQHNTQTLEKYQLVSSHTGRRSFVTNMFYRGYTPAEVMPMTGHTMTSIISIYNKTTAEDNAIKISKKIK